MAHTQTHHEHLSSVSLANIYRGEWTQHSHAALFTHLQTECDHCDALISGLGEPHELTPAEADQIFANIIAEISPLSQPIAAISFASKSIAEVKETSLHSPPILPAPSRIAENPSAAIRIGKHPPTSSIWAGATSRIGAWWRSSRDGWTIASALLAPLAIVLLLSPFVAWYAYNHGRNSLRPYNGHHESRPYNGHHESRPSVLSSNRPSPTEPKATSSSSLPPSSVGIKSGVLKAFLQVEHYIPPRANQKEALRQVLLPNTRCLVKDALLFRFVIVQAGYLYLLRISQDGSIEQLFPLPNQPARIHQAGELRLLQQGREMAYFLEPSQVGSQRLVLVHSSSLQHFPAHQKSLTASQRQLIALADGIPFTVTPSP